MTVFFEREIEFGQQTTHGRRSDAHAVFGRPAVAVRRQRGIWMRGQLRRYGVIGVGGNLGWPARARPISERLATPLFGQPALQGARIDAVGTDDLSPALPAGHSGDGSFTEVGGNPMLHLHIVPLRHNFRDAL